MWNYLIIFTGVSRKKMEQFVGICNRSQNRCSANQGWRIEVECRRYLHRTSTEWDFHFTNFQFRWKMSLLDLKWQIFDGLNYHTNPTTLWQECLFSWCLTKSGGISSVSEIRGIWNYTGKITTNLNFCLHLIVWATLTSAGQIPFLSSKSDVPKTYK